MSNQLVVVRKSALDTLEAFFNQVDCLASDLQGDIYCDFTGSDEGDQREHVEAIRHDADSLPSQVAELRVQLQHEPVPQTASFEIPAPLLDFLMNESQSEEPFDDMESWPDELRKTLAWVNNSPVRLQMVLLAMFWAGQSSGACAIRNEANSFASASLMRAARYRKP